MKGSEGLHYYETACKLVFDSPAEWDETTLADEVGCSQRHMAMVFKILCKAGLVSYPDGRRIHFFKRMPWPETLAACNRAVEESPEWGGMDSYERRMRRNGEQKV
jgi:hypothetical protein